MNSYAKNLKTMKNVTQVVPSKMEKYIKKNKSMYGKRIKQLEYIIKDDSYIPKEVPMVITISYLVCIGHW